MSKMLLMGAALWIFYVSTARAAPCDLEVKISENNRLHIVELCNGVEVDHGNWTVYHPKGEQYHDAAHKCRLLNIE